MYDFCVIIVNVIVTTDLSSNCLFNNFNDIYNHEKI